MGDIDTNTTNLLKFDSTMKAKTLKIHKHPDMVKEELPKDKKSI
jgi:hypothetical protein